MYFRKRNQKAREHPNQWLLKVQISQSVFPPHRLTISITFTLQVFLHAAVENSCVLMRLIPHERHNTTSIEVHLRVMLMLHFTVCCRRKQQNPFILTHLKPSFCSYQQATVLSHLALSPDGDRAVCKPLTT